MDVIIVVMFLLVQVHVPTYNLVYVRVIILRTPFQSMFQLIFFFVRNKPALHYSLNSFRLQKNYSYSICFYRIYFFIV